MRGIDGVLVMGADRRAALCSRASRLFAVLKEQEIQGLVAYFI